MRVNNLREGPHLQKAPGGSDLSFTISSVKLFLDIETSYRDGFHEWLLKESDEQVLERAAPRLLEIKQNNNECKAAFDNMMLVLSE